MKHKFYPVRVYLHDTIVNEHRFPFWTEKIYAGFPIYADSENAYLQPINVLATVLLDPILSYKLVHLLMYLLGSYGLYLLLKSRNVGLLGYFVANIIFYFSYFLINHQIHQSLILTFYTFPLSLHLLERFLTTRLHRFTILNVLVMASAFYWGHPQMFILYWLGLLIYTVAFHGFGKNVTYLLMLGWFVFLLSLPQLNPSLVLKGTSVRADSQNVSAEQGSFHPLMVLTLVYPSLFQNQTDYQGKTVSSDYSFVETYNYLGVTVIIGALIALSFIEDKKLKRYVFYSWLVYLALSYSKFIPVLNLQNIPVVNLFRYWTRSVVLFNFALAFLVGIFIDALYNKRLEVKKWSPRSILFFLTPLLILMLVNSRTELTGTLLQILPRNILQSYDVKKWIAMVVTMLALTTSLLWFYRKNRNVVNILVILVVLCITVDLRFFSNELLASRTDNIKNLERVSIPDGYENKRILVEKGEIENNESLLYAFWWPFGYSQYKDKNYYDYFKSHNIDTITQPKSANLGTEDYEIYRNIGVTAIIFDRKITPLNTNSLDLIQNDILGEYVYKTEGHIKFITLTPKDQLIETYIHMYPGWELKVNGKKAPLDMSNMFLEFTLPKGPSIVELTYTPVHFYYGLIASAVGLLATFTVVNFRKRFSKPNSYLMQKVAPSKT